MHDLAFVLSAEFHVHLKHVKNVIELIDAGNTIPFIARYRKEATGSMDDQLLRRLALRLDSLRSLEKRRDEIRAAIENAGKLSSQIESQLESAATLAELEDVYRPFKQKRKTRALVARAKGLDALAQTVLAQNPKADPKAEALKYVDEEVGVTSVEQALEGAMDIIAEQISDDPSLRKQLRSYVWQKGAIASSGEGGGVYAQYSDFSQSLRSIAHHRVLAINRGERKGELSVKIVCEREQLEFLSVKAFRKNNGGRCGQLVEAAARDALKRLIWPSLEREIRQELTERANQSAIEVFCENLRNLLMQPPVRSRVVMGVDPAYRTGCKIAVVDERGSVLDTAVVFPTPPQSKTKEAAQTLTTLIKKHGVSVMAIGNGTASRETEAFVQSLIKSTGLHIEYAVVSEAGASVYSASQLAAAEFPDYDVSLRSAVSIARRLLDPLSELVKIDPKAIGVGQYQHDMKASSLSAALNGVVECCVNTVGADLNTASAPLLSHVAGINAAIAQNIIEYREQKGGFACREQLKEVPRLGERTFEQCAGFLRIAGGVNPLDATAVHPESYGAALKLLRALNYSENDIVSGNMGDIDERIKQKGELNCARIALVGLPTLADIAAELKKPGRDARDAFPPPLLRSDVLDFSDLKPGMTLKGTVRNVVDFGAFVDIGLHEDGLVHISQMAGGFVRRPQSVVKVGDIVTVRVIEADEKLRRISLSMKLDEGGA